MLPLLAACGRGPDPLAEERARLAEQPPLAEGWAPQAVLTLSESTLESLALDRLRLLSPIVLPVPLGLPIPVQPSVQTFEVELAAVEVCPSCVQVHARAEGELRATLPPLLVERRFPGAVSVRGTLRSRSEGGDLYVEWADQVLVDAELTQLPEALQATSEGFVEGWLTQRIQDLAAAQRPVFQTVGGGPLGPSGLRLRASDQGDLLLDLAFPIPQGGVAEPIALDEGWALSIPTSTLLHLLQSYALRQDPDARYAFEPVDLGLQGARWWVDVRWHRRRASPSWRTLRLHGTLELVDEALVIDVDRIEPQSHHRWPGRVPVGLLERRVDQVLSEGQVRLPASFPVGSSGMALRAQAVSIQPDVGWVVQGDVQRKTGG